VTTDPGVTTTWDPNQTVTTTPEITTTAPEETTEPETTARVKYTLKSNVTGTPESEPTNPYNERWIHANVYTPTGAPYAAKLKFWVYPPTGKADEITIEYKGEMFPNGIPSSIPQAPVTQTPLVKFKGKLLDKFVPAMIAQLDPTDASNNINEGLVFPVPKVVPGQLEGSLSGTPPSGLDPNVWSAIKAGAPALAKKFVMVEGLQLELLSNDDFRGLPSSANAFAKVTLKSYYTVTYSDDDGSYLPPLLGPEPHDEISVEQLFMIQVIVDDNN
jgi:hypothetical protein